jgi:hypothetical protein
MKQASFKIGEVEKMKMTNERTTSTDERTSSTNERTSSTNEGNQQNISSKKPIKCVENIYYFRSSS